MKGHDGAGRNRFSSFSGKSWAILNAFPAWHLLLAIAVGKGLALYDYRSYVSRTCTGDC